MKINLKRYEPPKPFYKMSIDELLKYNDKCKRLDKIYFTRKRGGRKRKTRNRKNRKTRKRKKRTRKISLQIKKMEVEK